jgi:hypothetical protein
MSDGKTSDGKTSDDKAADHQPDGPGLYVGVTTAEAGDTIHEDQHVGCFKSRAHAVGNFAGATADIVKTGCVRRVVVWRVPDDILAEACAVLLKELEPTPEKPPVEATPS